MRCCVADMESSWFRYWIFRSGRATVPASVSIFHPRTSFTQVQSPSPALSFFMLIESLASLGKDGRSHLRACTVPLKNWRCHSDQPCTAVIMSSIQRSIWARLSRVWGGPRPVSGILAMAMNPGTGINVCTSAFTIFVSVSENVQKTWLSQPIPSVVTDRCI